VTDPIAYLRHLRFERDYAREQQASRRYEELRQLSLGELEQLAYAVVHSLRVGLNRQQLIALLIESNLEIGWGVRGRSGYLGCDLSLDGAKRLAAVSGGDVVAVSILKIKDDWEPPGDSQMHPSDRPW